MITIHLHAGYAKVSHPEIAISARIKSWVANLRFEDVVRKTPPDITISRLEASTAIELLVEEVVELEYR